MAALSSQRVNLDSVITYILLKKIVTPIVRTKAYKLKLVDATGRTLREPVTPADHEAFTLLDKTVFKLKRLLGGKLGQLFNFMYVATLSNDYYNKILVKGSVEQRAEIMRLRGEVGRLGEQYNIPFDDFLVGIMHEDMRVENMTNLDEIETLAKMAQE